MAISSRALGPTRSPVTRTAAPAVRRNSAPAPKMSPVTRASQRLAAANGTAGHAPIYHPAPLRAPTKAHIGE